MKFKTESKRIGSHTYHVTQLNAVAGRRELVRLAKVVGPAFAVAKQGEDAAIAKLVECLSEKDFEHFCDVFAGQTQVTGGAYDEDAEPQLEMVFAEHFAGNYLEMIQWLVFAMKVNFGSFFAGAIREIAKQRPKSPEESATPSTSPTMSTGTSGES